ncbi:high mobility group family B protein [Micromonas pusilla CCMP1545]|uniref:High mobility group family B protein n=1 Tax=Micromonas pusilla (strain CCMP1545) TaxID=564608 RepID=C1N7Y3_MICPC|nr:high mobility group family B protein [Micromonas pusilla CCMP1545]EEH51794.1 high mobility group family B protein [Micromonas pusilla CCMP1545]|eukprot:XP_003064172.1 high mobility group family B protein [Micromonas pusilla CCMP1545]
MAPKKETKNALVVERLHVILADADLETMTVKNVQAKLESELKTDIERGTKRKADGSGGKAGKKSKDDKKGKKRGRGKGKDVTDPNKPKGPKGAYMCFVQIARPKINASQPGLKFAEIAKQLGEQWKSMDAPTRAKYDKLAEDDKLRYARDIAAYVPMDAAGLDQLRKEKQAKKSAGGLQKPYKCTPALTKFLGGDKTISRANLTSRLWSYFKSKELMDPANKRWVVADKQLKDLLGVDRFQGFTVSKYLSQHLLPMDA